MAFGKNEMKKLLDITETCLEEMSKKPTHTPAETNACKDGLEIRAMLKCELEDCEAKEHGEEYSGYRAFPRHYSMTAYGMPDGMHDNYAGYPGQPRSWNGQYASGMPDPDGWRIYGKDYDGYSRHSIGDRAVEKLEHLMDATGSAYEKEELRKFIGLIKREADK
jgi:hypothetical protein